MDPAQKALWFVESHSNEPIGLEDIARVCNVSAYHLTRSFAATMGLSLMRYVRGRRLSEAARRLADGASDILRVALDAGYGSHEAFSRAFRDQFGLTPEQVRMQGHADNIVLVEAIPMKPAPVADIAPDRFVTSEPTTFAGLVERCDCGAPQGIPGQWQKFGPFINHINGQVGGAAYGVIYNFDSDGNFDYMCAVEVRDSSSLPEGFKTLRVPRQKYAVFTHKGHVAGIRGTISAIWNKWFPTSGFQSSAAPTLERYGPEFNPLTGLGGFEIWVAIEE
jgi:AraC family transcriptional regulator